MLWRNYFMSKALILIIYNCQCLVIILSFLISLKLVKNKSIPDYMRGFYWYPSIALVIILPGFFTENYFRSYRVYSSILTNLSLIFHYSFLSIFIIKVMPKGISNNFLKIFFLFFLSLLIFLLIYEKLEKQNTFAFATANLGLTIFCIIYYYRLFNNLPIVNLKREPSFWIITGVFFCMSMHIPLISVSNYLYENISLSTSRLINSIAIFCYLIMHLFFIKAYLCSVRPQKQ